MHELSDVHSAWLLPGMLLVVLLLLVLMLLLLGSV